MPLYRVVLLSFAAVMSMVNPLAVIPPFIVLTDRLQRRARARVALAAAAGSVVVLVTFLLAGNFLFSFFGITVPAFQIMGGILFLVNALWTLVVDERRSEKRMEDSDVEKAEVDPTSIAIVPLAIPLLSGPGAITSVMVLVNLYPGIEQKMAVTIAIAAVGVISYVVLLAALPISHVMGDRGRAVFAKVMALLLGAIGIQFIINGVKPVMMEILTRPH
ncbi:MAG TPA: NAAT family transporter [Thermoanaerobaculia bacterium]|nr:NAAT family transporter [Thermoanaerobaculia bacterium]